MPKFANEVNTLRRKLREQELKLTEKAGMFNVLEYLESADQWFPFQKAGARGLRTRSTTTMSSTSSLKGNQRNHKGGHRFDFEVVAFSFRPLQKLHLADTKP